MKQNSNIRIKNIYFMLSYAFQTLRQSVYEDLAIEEFENMQTLFAAILSKGIGYQIKQGLYREYRSRLENRSALRGKVNIAGTIKNRGSNRPQLACEYDELSEDNLFNRILKTTALLLIRSSEVKTEYRDALRKEMLYFSNVGTVELKNIKWSDLRFQRNNQTYRMLVSICQLIVEGMLLTTKEGEYRLASFVDEQRMSRLYEKFILEYYRQTYPELSVNASQIPWALDDDISRTMLPVMQTDVTIEKGNDILIIDAKYYSHNTQINFDKHTIHSNNIYQMYAYVKNKESSLKDVPHSVSGMLLYAKTEDEIQPDQDFQLDGNAFSVKTLDLNKEFSSIKEQLDSFIQMYF